MVTTRSQPLQFHNGVISTIPPSEVSQTPISSDSESQDGDDDDDGYPVILGTPIPNDSVASVPILPVDTDVPDLDDNREIPDSE